MDKNVGDWSDRVAPTYLDVGFIVDVKSAMIRNRQITCICQN